MSGHTTNGHACEGKVHHASPQMAWYVLLKSRWRKEEHLQVYRCSCGKWCIGSDVIGKWRRARRRESHDEQ